MLVCLAGVHLSVVGGLGCVTGLGLGIFPRDVLALQQAIGIRGSSNHHNAGPVIHIKKFERTATASGRVLTSVNITNYRTSNDARASCHITPVTVLLFCIEHGWETLARLYLRLEVLVAVLAPCPGGVGGRVSGGFGVGTAHHVTWACKALYLSTR